MRKRLLLGVQILIAMTENRLLSGPHPTYPNVMYSLELTHQKGTLGRLISECDPDTPWQKIYVCALGCTQSRDYHGEIRKL